MKHETTVKVLRVMVFLLGILFCFFSPDLKVDTHVTNTDVVIVRVVGVILVLIGLFITTAQRKLSVVKQGSDV